MQEYQNSKNNQFSSNKSSHRDKRFTRKSLWHFSNTKRSRSAEGPTLHPAALRPRLVSASMSITVITIIAGLYCISNVSAATVTLTVPQNISVNTNPVANGGFTESANSQIRINNSSKSGYTLSIKAKDATNGNNLVNVGNQDIKLNSIPEKLTLDEYKNGKNGNDFINTWAFKPDVINNQANNNYLPGPTTSDTKIAETTSNTLSGETFNFAIATKIDDAFPVGNYSSDFILTATGNNYKYSIKFNSNGGTGGPSGPMTGEVTSPELQIVSNTPTLQGKDFLGWCSRTPISDGSCPGITVQPNGYFPLCDGNLDITLYAMWGTPSTGGGGGQFAGLADGTACEYKGKKGKVYGGKCWMTSDAGNTDRWLEAFNICNRIGWILPSQEDFSDLIARTGGAWSTNGLNNALGLTKEALYWSSSLAYAYGIDDYDANYYSDIYAVGLSYTGTYAALNNLNTYYSNRGYKPPVRCVAL